MTQICEDWHREDIKARIRKTGITMAALVRQHRLHDAAANKVLLHSWPRVEAIVAERLGIKPQEIWPSRYDDIGAPLRGLHASARHNLSGEGIAAPSQKRKAA